MKRHRDRYQGSHDDDRGGEGRDRPFRGRYVRDDEPARAQAVHWEADSHLPGSDADDGYAPAAPGGQRRGYGRQAYGRGLDRVPNERDGEHRGHGPRGFVRSDARILEQVCEHLTDDTMVDARGIEVRCKDGEVVLEGEVPNRWMKHRAEDIAVAVAGDEAVDNRIRVRRGRAPRPGGTDDLPPGSGALPQQPH